MQNEPTNNYDLPSTPTYKYRGNCFICNKKIEKGVKCCLNAFVDETDDEFSNLKKEVNFENKTN